MSNGAFRIQQEADGINATVDDMTYILMPQKNMKQRNCTPPMPSQLVAGRGLSPKIVTHIFSRWPRHRSTIECQNQPQATRARKRAGIFAPLIPKRRAAIDRKRDAILGTRVRIQNHGDEHDDIGEKNREDGL